MNVLKVTLKALKVYILSFHEDRGAEDVRATLDPSKLRVMLADMCARYDPEDQDRLAQALSSEKCPREGIRLTRDWGGPTLHIADLE
ncbi:hypothetical protein [Nitrosospira sp. Nl5]|uniref:hypothetical protein n=1 Tax=Nitrosospira sp. Nl5 TaxID=200120 RepID=UPI00115FDB6E|nr:hypothetical protein [Nitrosospira sp. Nl5]